VIVLALLASMNGSSLTGLTAPGSLIDNSGNVWTLNAGVVYENGIATTSSGVLLLEYCGGVMYQMSMGWAQWSNGWTFSLAPNQASCTASIPSAPVLSVK
jgi:hypothetical protein